MGHLGGLIFSEYWQGTDKQCEPTPERKNGMRNKYLTNNLILPETRVPDIPARAVFTYLYSLHIIVLEI